MDLIEETLELGEDQAIAIEGEMPRGQPPGSRWLVVVGMALVALGIARISPRTVESLELVWGQIRETWRPRPWGPPLGLAVADAVFEIGRIGWPVFLGLAISLGKRPSLMRAGSLTLLVMAIESFTSVAMVLRSDDLFALWPWAILALMRSILELGGFLLAWRAADVTRTRSRALGERPGRPAAVLGRLAIIGAMTFSICAFGLKAWDAYIDLVSSNPRVRGMILLADTRPRRAERVVNKAEANLLQEGEKCLRTAAEFAAKGLHAEAIRAYRRGLTLGDRARALKTIENSSHLHYQAFLIRNNLAWMLLTCPDSRLRKPAEAATLAKTVVEFLPSDGNYWNTLGLGLYRTDQISDASDAIERSLALRGGGDPYDFYILAMIRVRQNRPSDARVLYDRAEASTQALDHAEADLLELRVEAARLTGLDEPGPIVHDPGRSLRTSLKLPAPPLESTRAKAIDR